MAHLVQMCKLEFDPCSRQLCHETTDSLTIMSKNKLLSDSSKKKDHPPRFRAVLP